MTFKLIEHKLNKIFPFCEEIINLGVHLFRKITKSLRSTFASFEAVQSGRFHYRK